MDLALLIGIALPGVIFVMLIGTLFWIAARKRRTAADLARRKREVLERGDPAAAAAIDHELSAIDQRSYWPKPLQDLSTTHTPRKSLARSLLIGGFVLAVLSALGPSAAGTPRTWFDLAASITGIIMIVASVILDPPWRKA